MSADGRLSARFLVHGGRHVDPHGDALASVFPGDRLELRPEPENPSDPRAVLVVECDDSHRPLGYAPRVLAPFIHELWSAGVEPSVFAEHVNEPADPLASDQMRLLVRLDCTVPPVSTSRGRCCRPAEGPGSDPRLRG